MASTRLDEVLLRRWDIAACEGVLRTNVDDTMRRRIPGLGLVIQFNPSHLKSKRPVDKQLLAPAASTKPQESSFNFTKAKRPEFLSSLRFLSSDEQHLPCVHAMEMADETEASKNDAEHFVLVNVAPLVRGHVLFVLDLNLVKPQKMTQSFLLYGVSICVGMQCEDFALGFNSAGAWSSVNHFHLQGYFFPQVEAAVSLNFPVAVQRRQEMFRTGGAIVSNLPSWQTTCYVVEPEDAARDAVVVVQVAWALLELLQAREIPHNLLIVDTVIFIFPRQPQCENGVGLFPTNASNDSTTVHTGRLRIAVAELSGLVVAGDRVVYESLTEELFNLILQKDVSLSASEEAAIVAEWEAKLGVKMT